MEMLKKQLKIKNIQTNKPAAFLDSLSLIVEMIIYQS